MDGVIKLQTFYRWRAHCLEFMIDEFFLSSFKFYGDWWSSNRKDTSTWHRYDWYAYRRIYTEAFLVYRLTFLRSPMRFQTGTYQKLFYSDQNTSIVKIYMTQSWYE